MIERKKTTVSTLFEKSQAAAAFSLSKKIKEIY
jgi:hypothetical protein